MKILLSLIGISAVGISAATPIVINSETINQKLTRNDDREIIQDLSQFEYMPLNLNEIGYGGVIFGNTIEKFERSIIRQLESRTGLIFEHYTEIESMVSAVTGEPITVEDILGFNSSMQQYYFVKIVPTKLGVENGVHGEGFLKLYFKFNSFNLIDMGHGPLELNWDYNKDQKSIIKFFEVMVIQTFAFDPGNPLSLVVGNYARFLNYSVMTNNNTQRPITDEDIANMKEGETLSLFFYISPTEEGVKASVRGNTAYVIDVKRD
ncbi:hypothetical protein STIUS_v1c06610 [Spiroplasma sp. TIUS-1]|uniref:hypothetical protein n=1 Tax=Spiroplasma sp. TIUS-1 TaxID=216963 RepID=UPI0013992E4B|nr:hypothetical protein [Spiroplasma sp. TIUS-1]QHX36215.1 hypothetical protein STIUS_v1c06610 [Spiroplasma sp. TIUS-1]